MRKKYASQLTRADLIESGITCITADGRVYKGETEVTYTVNKQGYLTITLYSLDENGNRIKVVPKNCTKKGYYCYKTYPVAISRAMWAWFHGIVPEGMVVDHINNKHELLEDYTLDNLQLITPYQNTTKDRVLSTAQLRCKLNKPRSHYESKLASLKQEYEAAKAAHNTDRTHKLRSAMAQYRARLRYYDANIEKAQQLCHEVQVNKMKKALKQYSRQENCLEIKKFLNNYTEESYETLVKLYKTIIGD